MDLNDFLEEAAIMKEMKHANLVQLLGNGCCTIHYWPVIAVTVQITDFML